MAVDALEELLTKLREVLAQQEQREAELRQALEQVVAAKLMQAGAVQGVELAMKAVGITDSPDSADGTD